MDFLLCVFNVFVNTPESMKNPFREAELLPMLKKMLEDPDGAVEVKFSALGLICTLANSSMCLLLQHTEFPKMYVPKLISTYYRMRKKLNEWVSDIGTKTRKKVLQESLAKTLAPLGFQLKFPNNKEICQ